jgi:hypothetical protein
MRSIVHVVSIIVLASIYARTAVHTPPARAAVATHGAPAAAGNGSCRTKPSDPSGHLAREIPLSKPRFHDSSDQARMSLLT